jgi:hypothetical protein
MMLSHVALYSSIATGGQPPLIMLGNVDVGT